MSVKQMIERKTSLENGFKKGGDAKESMDDVLNRHIWNPINRLRQSPSFPGRP